MQRDPGEYLQSWYAASANGYPEFDELDQDIEADVCVVGGGFTGITAALELVERGKRVVLLEARRVGWGASGRNGGQLGAGQNKDQTWLEQKMSASDARRMWDIAEDGKESVKRRIAQHDIDCDLRSGLLYTCHKKSYVDEYRDYAAHLNNRYDYDAIRYVDKDELDTMLGTDVYFGATLDSSSGHLHPLNYVHGLARAARDAGVVLFENSPVVSRQRDADQHVVSTARARVRASSVIVATNGYVDGLEPSIEPEIMPINSYIIATEPLGEERARSIIRDNVGVADSRFVVHYYRFSSDWRMLFGGRENYTANIPKGFGNGVRKSMLGVFPQLRDAAIEYQWGGTLAVTMSRLPKTGEIEPGVFYGHGFSGHGVALTAAVARVLAKAVTGDRADFELLRDAPGSHFPGGKWLRAPGQVAAMLYYAMRDRL